jgi:predicted DNA-binding protein
MSNRADEHLGPIRLSAELLEQLKELAKLNERTVAGEARLALRNHVERNLHSKRAPEVKT